MHVARAYLDDALVQLEWDDRLGEFAQELLQQGRDAVDVGLWQGEPGVTAAVELFTQAADESTSAR